MNRARITVLCCCGEKITPPPEFKKSIIAAGYSSNRVAVMKPGLLRNLLNGYVAFTAGGKETVILPTLPAHCAHSGDADLNRLLISLKKREKYISRHAHQDAGSRSCGYQSQSLPLLVA